MKVSKIIICSLILFSSIGVYAQKSNVQNAYRALEKKIYVGGISKNSILFYYRFGDLFAGSF